MRDFDGHWRKLDSYSSSAFETALAVHPIVLGADDFGAGVHSLPRHPAGRLAASVVALRSLQGSMTENCFVVDNSSFRHPADGRAEYHLDAAAAHRHHENLLEAGSCSSSSENDYYAVVAAADDDVVAAGYQPTFSCRNCFGLNYFARAYCRKQLRCCLARSCTGCAEVAFAAVPNSDARCH